VAKDLGPVKTDRCPKCGGVAKAVSECDSGFSIIKVVCEACGEKATAAFGVRWAWLYWYNEHGLKPSALPGDAGIEDPMDEDGEEDDDEVPVSEPAVEDQTGRKTDVQGRMPDGRFRGKAPRKKWVPDMGGDQAGSEELPDMVPLVDIARRTVGFRRPLKYQTLKARLVTGVYKGTKNSEGRWVLPREQALRVVEEWRAIQGLRSLPDLAEACGFTRRSFNPQADDGTIKVVKACGKMYVTDDEWARVTRYYGFLSCGEAAKVLGMSKGFIQLLTNEDGLVGERLWSGGERRFDVDELMKAVDRRRERLAGAKKAEKSVETS